MSGWQPIETAPKDGSDVLLLMRGGMMYVGRWRDGCLGEPQVGEVAWRSSCSGRFANPTHWCPLPDPPHS